MSPEQTGHPNPELKVAALVCKLSVIRPDFEVVKEGRISWLVKI
jgi:hypothetical protein